jgi:hypothetical protein
VLSVDSVDRLHEILVFLPPSAEYPRLVQAARADVVEAHPRLLIAISVPINWLQEVPGRLPEVRALKNGPITPLRRCNLDSLRQHRRGIEENLHSSHRGAVEEVESLPPMHH